jgi:adenosylcobinamide-GDP ribazoletransferase
LIRVFAEIISFLTILPIERFAKNKNLENISKKMYLFPLAGMTIGLLTFPPIIFSFYLYNSMLLIGLIITIYIIIITGAHHTDALADFADGIMVKGDKEKKYQVVHDPRIGAAGVIAITSYFAGMIITISSFNTPERLFFSILIAEIVSKYAMVFQAYAGKSAWPGYSSLFTLNMKSGRKIIISTAITITLVILLHPSYLTGLKMLVTGTVACVIIILISNRNFGGVTGDVMGATNEIVRLGCLMSSI